MFSRFVELFAKTCHEPDNLVIKAIDFMFDY